MVRAYGPKSLHSWKSSLFTIRATLRPSYHLDFIENQKFIRIPIPLLLIVPKLKDMAGSVLVAHFVLYTL